MRKQPVLVIGRNGQIASALTRKLESSGRPFLAMDRTEFNLASRELIGRVISTLRPIAVINAAAYAAFDIAEAEPHYTRRVNVDGAGDLAAAAAHVGAPIVHVSTEYVFNGRKNAAYSEIDATDPIGIYGAAKLDGEHRVATLNPRHVILRTAWVYSSYGPNFVRNVLRAARERDVTPVVSDLTGSPTSADDLAMAICSVLDTVLQTDARPDHFGVFNVAGNGSATWYALARRIMDGAAQRGVAKTAIIKPVMTGELPTRARRPINSILDTAKLQATYGITMPHWENGLARCLDQLLGSVGKKNSANMHAVKPSLETGVSPLALQ